MMSTHACLLKQRAHGEGQLELFGNAANGGYVCKPFPLVRPWRPAEIDIAQHVSALDHLFDEGRIFPFFGQLELGFDVVVQTDMCCHASKAVRQEMGAVEASVEPV